MKSFFLKPTQVILRKRLSNGLASAGLAVLIGASYSASAKAQECINFDKSSLAEKGKLTIAVSPTLPPMAYMDSKGKMIGFRIKLGDMIAKRLCLEANHVNIDYPAMIPGLRAGRFDVLNSFFVTEERKKMMYMVLTEKVGVAISVAKNNPAHLTKIVGMAGKQIGTQVGSYAEQQLEANSKYIVAKGLQPINVRLFDNYAPAFQALRAGQIDGVASIDPTASEFEKRGEFATAIHGLWATPAALCISNKTIGIAIEAAIKAMAADGSLKELSKQYEVPLPEDVGHLFGPDI